MKCCYLTCLKGDSPIFIVHVYNQFIVYLSLFFTDLFEKKKLEFELRMSELNFSEIYKIKSRPYNRSFRRLLNRFSPVSFDSENEEKIHNFKLRRIMQQTVLYSVIAQGARALSSYLKASLVTDTIKIKKKRFTYVSVFL